MRITSTSAISGATVDITGNVSSSPAPLGTGKTAIVKTLQQTTTNNTAYTVHTVTTGKTFYVQSIVISVPNSTTTFRFGVSLTGNAFSSTRAESNTLVGEVITSVHLQLGGILSFASEALVQFQIASAQNVSITIVGWEE